MKKVVSGAIFAVCLAAVTWTGCSGKRASETSTQEGRQTAAASSSSVAGQPEADNRPLIVAFGDSLTSGVVEHSYPEYLQQLLDRNGFQFRVENQGVAGDTTSDGVARIANVTAEKPVLVILEFGGNDGLRGLPVEASKQNLEIMIRQLKQQTRVVLLGITLPPNYGPDYVKPFTAMFPELAHKYRLPFLPFLLLNVYQQQNLMQPDGIHPNSEGNKVVAKDVFTLIRPYLAQLRTR